MSYTLKEKVEDPRHPSHFNKDLLVWYNRFREEIVPSLYHNPHDVHGISHIERVLKLSLTLINYLGREKLSLNDLLIVGLSAVYHDIGRVNDDVDFEHGNQAVVKLKELKLLEKFLTKYNLIEKFHEDNDNLLTLHFIIANHNVGDKYAQAVLNDSDINNKEHAWFLYCILCDSDNLDRVRLGDLDIRFLRLIESLEIVDYAFYLLRNLEEILQKYKTY